MNVTPDFDRLRVTESSPWKNGSSRREETDLVVYLEKYYSLVLLIFGTVGNLLCLAVLSRKTFRRSSVGIYLRFLTLSDLTAIYTGVLFFTARSLFNNNFRKIDELSCKFHRWLSFTACDLSSWALVLVSSARLISIAWPMKRIITRRRVYYSILITVVVLLLANFPIFVIYGDLIDPATNKTKLCALSEVYEEFYNHVFSWLVLLKFGFLPGVLLIVLNTALVLTVSHSGKAVDKMESESMPDTEVTAANLKMRCHKCRKHNAGHYKQETDSGESTRTESSKVSVSTDDGSVGSSLTTKKSGLKGITWNTFLERLMLKKMSRDHGNSGLGHVGLENWLRDLGLLMAGNAVASSGDLVHLTADQCNSGSDSLPAESENNYLQRHNIATMHKEVDVSTPDGEGNTCHKDVNNTSSAINLVNGQKITENEINKEPSSDCLKSPADQSSHVKTRLNPTAEIFGDLDRNSLSLCADTEEKAYLAIKTTSLTESTNLSCPYCSSSINTDNNLLSNRENKQHRKIHANPFILKIASGTSSQDKNILAPTGDPIFSQKRRCESTTFILDKCLDSAVSVGFGPLHSLRDSQENRDTKKTSYAQENSGAQRTCDAHETGGAQHSGAEEDSKGQETKVTQEDTEISMHNASCLTSINKRDSKIHGGDSEVHKTGIQAHVDDITSDASHCADDVTEHPSLSVNVARNRLKSNKDNMSAGFTSNSFSQSGLQDNSDNLGSVATNTDSINESSEGHQDDNTSSEPTRTYTATSGESEHRSGSRNSKKSHKSCLHHLHPYKRRKSSTCQPAGKSSSKSRSLTRTLLVLNTVFLLCNSPITVYMTGKTYFWPDTDGYSPLQDAVVTIANFSMYTNNAINFILYCITGSRFRRQLVLMFKDLYHVVLKLALRLSTVCKSRN